MSLTLLLNGAVSEASSSLSASPTSELFSAVQSFVPSPQKAIIRFGCLREIIRSPLLWGFIRAKIFGLKGVFYWGCVHKILEDFFSEFIGLFRVNLGDKFREFLEGGACEGNLNFVVEFLFVVIFQEIFGVNAFFGFLSEMERDL